MQDTDHCIIIHDGRSIGTRNEWEMAKKLGKPITYYLLDMLEEPILDLDSLGLDTGEMQEYLDQIELPG